MTNYFSVFNLTPTFDLDLSDLEKSYFTVQRTTHPDRFIGKSPAERQQAILASMRANEAYDALKQPLTRARHLLALQDIQVGSEKDSLKPSHALLMEIMELREALEEASSAEQLQTLSAQNAEAITVLQAKISVTFMQQKWDEAAQQVIKLGYLLKISDEIRLKSKAR